jgi:hypothetical protein
MEEAVKVRGKENTWKKWNEAKEKSGAYSKGRRNQKEEEGKLTCLLQWKMQSKRKREINSWKEWFEGKEH